MNGSGPSARLLDGAGAHPGGGGHPPRRLLRLPRGLWRPTVRPPPPVDAPRRHLKPSARPPARGEQARQKRSCEAALPWRWAGGEKKSSGSKLSTSSSRSSSASSRPSTPYSRSQRSRKAGEADTRRHHSGEKSSTSYSGVASTVRRPRYRAPEGTKGSAQGFSLPPLPLTTAIGFFLSSLLLRTLSR
uniref:Uncharacterized protein n=1 Tax=Zea mays TaxID=4577 RepID=A0A804QCF6_MAIZE